MGELITQDVEGLYEDILRKTSPLLRDRVFDFNSILVDIIDSPESHSDPFRPFLIGYAHLSMSLNDVFFKLGMSNYCGKICDAKPLGCCTEEILKPRVHSELFLKLQEVESRRNGHVDEQGNCKYHARKSGCSLYRFKSPTCLGYLCNPLKTKLASQEGQSNEYGVQFMNDLYRVWTLRFAEDFEPMTLASVLTSMSSAVKLGEILERDGFRISGDNVQAKSQ